MIQNTSILFSPLTQKTIDRHKNIGVLGGTYFIPNSLLPSLHELQYLIRPVAISIGISFIPPINSRLLI